MPITVVSVLAILLAPILLIRFRNRWVAASLKPFAASFSRHCCR